MTFITNYCRGANLHEVLGSHLMPHKMNGCISHLLSLYDSKPYISQSADSVQKLQGLSAETLQRLIEKLNSNGRDGDGTVWIGSHLWCEMENNKYFGSVASQVEILGVKYATSTYNVNNSVIVFRNDSLKHPHAQEEGFGQIEQIFHHRRVCPKNITTVETFLSVGMFSSRVPTACDVFKQLGLPDLQAHVRFTTPTTPVLLRTCEVVAHAAWLIYHSGEFHERIEQDTIAMVNTDCD